MTIPDFMPILSAGGHLRPEDGGCIMEMGSFLAGEEWSAYPKCTHPALAEVARNVNDNLDGEHRHMILPLLGMLIGANAPTTDPRLRAQIRATDWVYTAGMREPKRSHALVKVLSDLIDVYDDITGRTEHHEVTPVEMASLVELVGAR